MSYIEEGSPEIENSGNRGGVILGYWDHEKTPALIQDLERSVTLIEDKCKQLLEELVYYKRCEEESRNLSCRLVRFESKSDISKSCSLYGSEPDLVHRQNLINYQELQHVFEERFQQKLSRINKELTEVAHKIGLKNNNVILFPTKDYLKALNEQIENEAQKSWCNNRDKFFKSYLLNENTKSDSLIPQHGGGEGEFSKITKNELATYQKLSGMKMERTRSRKKGGKADASKGDKVKKLNGRWKSLRLRQDQLPSKSKQKKKKSGRKECKRRQKRPVRRTDSGSPRNSRSTLISLGKLSDSEIEKICKLLSESVCKKKVIKSGKSRPEIRGSATWEPRKCATPYSSYSVPLRSSDLSNKVGKLVHLKRRRPRLRVSASENISRRTEQRDIFSRSTTHVGKGRPILRASSDMKNEMSKRQRNGRAKRKRKVWTEKKSTSNIKKYQLKCTISLTRGIMGETKSLETKLNVGPKSSNKSRRKRTCTANSKSALSDCHRNSALDGFKLKRSFEKASGDGSCNNRHSKQSHRCTKTQSSLLNNQSKREISLKKNSKGDMTLVDEELKCLEKEVFCSLDKYKNLLRFYSKSLNKNNRIKRPKIACQATMFGPVKGRKSWYCNPVYISAMKKVFKEVEALQEKIKLLNN